MKEQISEITLSDIIDAKKLIVGHVTRTPILNSSSINRITGAEVSFKCENFQKVGAFKFRGATNAVLSLSQSDAAKGVATHSSGNHAQALALAASHRNIPAYIVMPNNSPIVKSDAVREYGGKIIFCEPTLQAREDTLNQVVEETGAIFIHPYNNYKVICGQGTATLEILEDMGDIDCIIAPVGGGGLLSGTSLAAKSIASNIKVYAAEPEGADDAYRSFKSGAIVPSVNPKTIADGLLTSLGDKTFAIISKYTDDIFRVSEIVIIEAMKLIWQRMKIVVEPSAAVTLAAILSNSEFFKGKKVVCILSGGNVDLAKLPF
ncbi:MAG: pyridoxal-phosphate dependent enzyme [Desulfobulbaceae bacterium]|nr:pyridoxal-phosphate dependent enzyme [Candidatus Kapabacteria bacterium]MBS3999615.1 pyridoxal-phosphate dependent enzyme [Desulfobulbaceae bacterium]